MSNYGFATYNGKAHNRLEGIVNSKWPIFGPKYKDIQHSYKTYHISDTTTNVASAVDLGVAQPTINHGEKSAHRYYKEEVFREAHGYKKRPLGYVMVTGNAVKNVRGYINQYHTGSAPDYGGDFVLSGVHTATIPVVSSLQHQMYTAYTSTGYDSRALTLTKSFFTIYDGSQYFPDGDIKVPTAAVSAIKRDYGMYNGNDPDYVPIPGEGVLPPYTIEIDDTDIVIYRNTYKLECCFRTDGSGNTIVYDRVKGVTDMAGTEIDITVLLCPYTMEDLI